MGIQFRASREMDIRTQAHNSAKPVQARKHVVLHNGEELQTSPIIAATDEYYRNKWKNSSK